VSGRLLGLEFDRVDQYVAVLVDPSYVGAPSISVVVLTLDVDDLIRFGEFAASEQEEAVDCGLVAEHEPHAANVLLLGHGADPIAAAEIAEAS
jgi:hypothetical protein